MADSEEIEYIPNRSVNTWWPKGWNWYTSWLYDPDIKHLAIENRMHVNHEQLLDADPDLYNDMSDDTLFGLIMSEEGHDDSRESLMFVPFYSDLYSGRAQPPDWREALAAIQQWIPEHAPEWKLQYMDVGGGIQKIAAGAPTSWGWVYNPATDALRIKPYALGVDPWKGHINEVRELGVTEPWKSEAQWYGGVYYPYSEDAGTVYAPENVGQTQWTPLEKPWGDEILPRLKDHVERTRTSASGVQAWEPKDEYRWIWNPKTDQLVVDSYRIGRMGHLDLATQNFGWVYGQPIFWYGGLYERKNDDTSCYYLPKGQNYDDGEALAESIHDRVKEEVVRKFREGDWPTSAYRDDNMGLERDNFYDLNQDTQFTPEDPESVISCPSCGGAISDDGLGQKQCSDCGYWYNSSHFLEVIRPISADFTQEFIFLKFISLPQRILVGENTYHVFLLKEELGTDIFPEDTVAIGTGILKGELITHIQFDYGSEEGRAFALEQLRNWGAEKGYSLSENLDF